MKAVVQRVTRGSVTIAGQKVASINQGFVILLGVQMDDDRSRAHAAKIANLRIFSDENDKMNLSILDIQGDAIVVSQFT